MFVLSEAIRSRRYCITTIALINSSSIRLSRFTNLIGESLSKWRPTVLINKEIWNIYIEEAPSSDIFSVSNRSRGQDISSPLVALCSASEARTIIGDKPREQTLSPPLSSSRHAFPTRRSNPGRTCRALSRVKASRFEQERLRFAGLKEGDGFHQTL